MHHDRPGAGCIQNYVFELRDKILGDLHWVFNDKFSRTLNIKIHPHKGMPKHYYFNVPLILLFQCKISSRNSMKYFLYS